MVRVRLESRFRRKQTIETIHLWLLGVGSCNAVAALLQERESWRAHFSGNSNFVKWDNPLPAKRRAERV